MLLTSLETATRFFSGGVRRVGNIDQASACGVSDCLDNGADFTLSVHHVRRKLLNNSIASNGSRPPERAPTFKMSLRRHQRWWPATLMGPSCLSNGHHLKAGHQDNRAGMMACLALIPFLVPSTGPNPCPLSLPGHWSPVPLPGGPLDHGPIVPNLNPKSAALGARAHTEAGRRRVVWLVGGRWRSPHPPRCRGVQSAQPPGMQEALGGAALPGGHGGPVP